MCIDRADVYLIALGGLLTGLSIGYVLRVFAEWCGY